MTEHRYALLIGNNEFPNEKGLTPLRCPPQDVEGLAGVLKDSNRGQFQVTQLINQTKQAIETELLRVLNKAQKEDLVLIYFSGHGRQSNLKGRLYLAVKDTGLDLLQATAIAASQIKIFLDEAHCNRIVLILDCCYSGAIDTEFLHKGEQSSQVNQALQELSKDEGHGLHILTASTSIQTATEKQGDRYSVFTKHLIHGIETGAADKHSSGLIRLNELFQYVKEQVKGESAQTPQIFNHGDADLLIAHSGKSTLKERRKKTESFLHGLLVEKLVTADVYAEASKILTKSESELNASEKQRNLLLDDLFNQELEPIEFAGKWVIAGLIQDESPTIFSKKLGLTLVALVIVTLAAWNIYYILKPSPPIELIHVDKSQEVVKQIPEQIINQAKTWLEDEDESKWPLAIEQIQPFVKAGNANAINLLANSYFFGLGVKENRTKACQLFKLAIEAHNLDEKSFYDESCNKY